MLHKIIELYNQKKTIFVLYNYNYTMSTTKTIQSALI